MPSLFRVNVQNNRVILERAPGTFGIAWDGQSDAVTGGLMRIGLIRKQEGFHMLNEPELHYTRVGTV